MCKLRRAGRPASNTARPWRWPSAPLAAAWLPAVLLAAALLPALASASCLTAANPEIRRLQELVSHDASQALKQAQSLLDTLQGEPQSQATRSRIAALDAVEAQAYGILELDDKSRAAAERGLALVPNVRDQVHVQLLLSDTEAVYDSAGIGAAIRSIEGARASQPSGSPADTCLLIGRGLLEHRLGRDDLAIVSLTQAYRASKGATEAHIMAADHLSVVMRSMGDYAQALALNQERIDWDTAHDARMALSVSRFMRGQILKMMKKYQDAIVEFDKARSLSVSLRDPQGVAFADQRICEAHIELGQLSSAQQECSNALKIFSKAHSADSIKETKVLQARILLGLGHPDLALPIMNQVLDHGGVDLPPRIVGSVYQWRARVNAALHDYREAYDDLQEYLGRYTAANDAERVRQAGALRARFETDREIERNSSLKRELETTLEQSNRQAQELRWNTFTTVAGAGIIALLIYFLVSHRRYRAQLVQLASQDSLTGLPNRRRTLELALAAIEAANTTRKPLTIGIIDMDHFKAINDRCGHAAGDHVLKEFARAGREALREKDILGRWGGEEFLLLMPDTPIELALASLERLRTLVCGIRLPAGADGLQVSLSAGLASYDDTVKSFEDLIARADAALYHAKKEGRDLIRLAEADYENSSTGVRRALRLGS